MSAVSFCRITPVRLLLQRSSISTTRKADQEMERIGCPLCRNGLEKFGYKDVLLLRQFLTPDGLIWGRRQTGICEKMQKRIAKAIRRSRQRGYLPNYQSPTSNNHGKV